MIIYDFFVTVGNPGWLTDDRRKRGPKAVTPEGSKAKRCFDAHTGALKPGGQSPRVPRVGSVALPALRRLAAGN